MSAVWPWLVGIALGVVIATLIVLLTPPWGRWS